ncbi:hypothetical protein NE237_025711 [Protea cynaroides]|uniref:Uncharacterized protein n=1 Tax=Protea cynaroides TaxID=273540 RepID=A0A9Q0H5P5_9MAGN|nr:hypothetical protein NE237_025711 [Protea cynaroides]
MILMNHPIMILFQQGFLPLDLTPSRSNEPTIQRWIPYPMVGVRSREGYPHDRGSRLGAQKPMEIKRKLRVEEADLLCCLLVGPGPLTTLSCISCKSQIFSDQEFIFVDICWFFNRISEKENQDLFPRWWLLV